MFKTAVFYLSMKISINKEKVNQTIQQEPGTNKRWIIQTLVYVVQHWTIYNTELLLHVNIYV